MNYDKDWYNGLAKSKFQPPDWVFTPIWTLLYVLMFISLFLILISKFYLINLAAYVLFIVQLWVNLQWPFAFFREHNLRKSFLLSALLAVLVFLTMLVFFYISNLAGILFIPYFLWCCFAALLSFQILELNEW